ncbi:MAG: hypothetical protein QM704_14910 [Anaeromyxobacteraceae bacterium]
MSQQVRDALERAAQAERRKTSDLATMILEDWLESKGHLSKLGAPAKKKGRG